MIDNTYTFHEIIGFGGSAKVFSAYDYENNKVAIKAIRKDKDYTSEMEAMMVLREYLVMDHVGEHPNIIKHYSCNPEGILSAEGRTQTICYNVMEYCENGALSNIIHKTGAVEEDVGRFMFSQLVSAVQFLHDQQFSHLDIKLENLLLDERFNLKLADFGSGVSLVKTNGQTNNKVGTPLYMAPEVKNLEKGTSYDGLKADIYSLGVTLWILLLEELPDFTEIGTDGSTIGSDETNNWDSDMEYEESYTCQDASWKHLSPSCKDLLANMLQVDPSKRLTIEEVLTHKWLSMNEFSDMGKTVYSEMKARMEYIIRSTQS